MNIVLRKTAIWECSTLNVLKAGTAVHGEDMTGAESERQQGRGAQKR